MVRCFVTGGSGFIGSHIVRLLEQEGHEVHILIRKTSNLDLLEGTSARTVIGDVTDGPGMLDVVPDEIEWFFHNAAIMADWGGKKRFNKVNVEGVQNVLEVIRQKNIPRLIYTSSTAVYGFPDLDEPIPEGYDHAPTNEYQKSKLEAEKLIHESMTTQGIKATMVRPPTVVGKGDMFTGPILIERLRDGAMFTFGDGTNRQSFTHGEDVAQCLIKAAENFDVAAGNAYNVTSFTCEFIEFLDALRKEIGTDRPVRKLPYKASLTMGKMMGGLFRAFLRPNAPLLTSFRVRLFGSKYMIDDTKARTELGYEPRWNLESTARDMVEWGGFVKPR
jgi:dihydroflavonol-4-reductase